jgi:inosine/xanthosine triphosphate pyrophosphatase family protein
VDIILATANPAKVATLSRVVSHEVRISPLPDSLASRSIPDSVEGARTIEEIAEAKAVYWSLQLPGRVIAATDGALLIPALGNEWEPARTARFAGPNSSNRERIETLLRLAAHLSGDARRIGWREVLVVAVDGQVVAEWTNKSPFGLLAESPPKDLPESATGFWVPYIWHCPEYGNRRLADLTDDERAARIDHWSTLGSRLSDWCLSLTHSL